jgi:hypothetical protein
MVIIMLLALLNIIKPFEMDEPSKFIYAVMLELLPDAFLVVVLFGLIFGGQ